MLFRFRFYLTENLIVMRKHDVNTKKGKLINMQIALIAALCLAYVMHEVYTYAPTPKKTFTAKEDLNVEDVFETMGAVIPIPNQDLAVATTPTPKPKPIIKPIQPVKPEVVKNEVKISETPTSPSDAENKPSSTKVDTRENKQPIVSNNKTNSNKTGKTFSVKSVDVLPVYPGCEKLNTNEERATCFEEKVQRLINRKFSPDMGNEGSVAKIQRINLYFEVDQHGVISNIKAVGASPELIKEAKRVAKKLPKMTPAKSGKNNVKMAYNVPIVYQTRN